MDLDTQQVEALGRSRLKAALIEAGLEVATPERDNGIDLIAYRWHPESGEFTSRPIQMKTAREFIFGVDRKYERIPHLVMAYVMNVRTEHAIYALTYAEAEQVAQSLGWTETASWEAGGYTRTYGSKKLVEALAPYRMTPEKWNRFFATTPP
jgi:hypothetical protein